MKMKVLFTAALCSAALAAQATVPKPAAPAGGAAQSAALPPPPTVTGPSKVGTIDIQDAIRETIEGKKLYADLDARFKPKEDELKAESADITALTSKISAGANTMSQATKDDLNRQLTTKQRDLQQAGENAQSDYQNAQTDVMNTVGAKMMDIIKNYAQEHGYTYVIDVSLPWPQSPVLYFNPGAVITGDIVKLYDTAHPAGK